MSQRRELHEDLHPFLKHTEGTIEGKTAHPRSAPPYFAEPPIDPADRPKTRADCASVPRPCPFVGCRHNLYLEIGEEGTIHLRDPGVAPDEVPPHLSCSLDVAETGGETLEKVGEALGVTRERIRQIEGKALESVRKKERRFKRLVQFRA